MKNCQRKTIVLGIIFLFISVSISQSAIGSITNRKVIEQKQMALIDNKPLTNEPSYYAIIIGIEPKSSSISSNKYIDESAQSVYNQLIKGPNWNQENIKLLINENATKTNIKDAITSWLAPKESQNDIIVFYFNGNTYKMKWDQKSFGNTYSLPYDVSNTDYDADKITDKELDHWFDTLDSDHLSLILDTNYASYMHALAQWGRKIITSTGFLFPNQDTVDHDHKKSLFSYYLIKGLSGHADIDNDGFVSMTELFTYTQIKCVDYSLDHLKSSIKNSSIALQIPRMFNGHLGKLLIFTLPFGWKQLTDNGFGQQTNYATRGMTVFKDELYIGTQNNMVPNTMNMEEHSTMLMATSSIVPDFYSLFGNLTKLPIRIAMHIMTFASKGCEVWKYNYTTDRLTKVIGEHSISGISAGFNYHFNAAAAVLSVFKDYIYVGTWNTPIGSMIHPNRKGCEIWRSADGIHWEQVVGHQAPYTSGGFGNPDNSGAWSIKEFHGYLYVGTMNWDFSDQGGCEIWRSQDGLHWEQVIDHGFKSLMNDEEKKAINTYAWIMEVFNDELYMGTFNSRLWFQKTEGTGCQLWKTSNGVDWEKVMLPDGKNNGYKDGFGESQNYGIRRMVVYNNELYVGIASSFFHDHASEIWKYDGTTWTPIISDDVAGATPIDFCYDGFGNNFNKYIWSMTVTADNKLWVGTANGQVYLPFIFKRDPDRKLIDTDTNGFELWCFDGEEWEPVIKDELGYKPNGLGDITNIGARSMIEYPEGSGNIIIGTFKFLNAVPGQIRDGCELWMRYSVS